MSHRALGVQFHEYAPGDAYGDEEMHDEFGLEARTPSGHGSLLKWHHETGEVTEVWTDLPVRRQGLATAAWNEAQRRGYNVRHSPDRSPSGDAWARSVGGYLPPLKRGD